MLSPLTSWKPGDKIKNWAGNLEYSTNNLHEVGSIEEVQDFVKKYDKFKVLGSRHCFNRIADSNENLVSLKQMDQVVALDQKARTVTVGAGIKYGQLAPYLNSKGYALHNLASLPHISIAGACATATHGSGVKNGNLATAVSAIEMVTAHGDVLALSREIDGEKFSAAVVGLGALGVVTKVTLDIQPMFMMRQDVYLNLPLSQLKDNFDKIVSSGYSVSLFTDWQTKSCNEVWIKSRVGEGETFTLGSEFFGAKGATKNLHPIADLSAINCTEQMGVPGPWHDRLPHFRMALHQAAAKNCNRNILSRPITLLKLFLL